MPRANVSANAPSGTHLITVSQLIPDCVDGSENCWPAATHMSPLSAKAVPGAGRV